MLLPKEYTLTWKIVHNGRGNYWEIRVFIDPQDGNVPAGVWAQFGQFATASDAATAIQEKLLAGIRS